MLHESDSQYLLMTNDVRQHDLNMEQRFHSKEYGNTRTDGL